MTFDSVGYAGTVSDAEWASKGQRSTARYWVAGPGDLAPSVVSASARQVRLAAGSAGGYHIGDTEASQTDVTLPSLASGTRVDVAVLHRSWTPAGTPTGTTVVQVVSAATLAGALAGRAQSPGTTTGDDHPIAAYQISVSGSTTSVTLLADLRVWVGDGGATAMSDQVRTFLDDVGTRVVVGDVVWSRVMDLTNGQPAWRSTPTVAAAAVHTHAQSDVTGLPAALDARPTRTEVNTGLNDAHTYASQVAGQALETALQTAATKAVAPPNMTGRAVTDITSQYSMGVRFGAGEDGRMKIRAADGSGGTTEISVAQTTDLSSRRYKDTIEPYEVAPADVLALVPVTYHKRGNADGHREVGLIAEDSTAIPGLVVYDAQRRPDAITYGVLPLALLALARAQADLIADLTRRIEQLENGGAR